MLEAKTYTNIWNQDKKLYSIYEWQLPTPVSFRQLGLFVVGAVIWMPFMYLFQVPISTSWGFVLWFGFPVAVAIFGNRPIYEEKTLFQWVAGMAGFVVEPKHIMDGRPVEKSELMSSDLDEEDAGQHHFEISVWRRVRNNDE